MYMVYLPRLAVAHLVGRRARLGTTAPQPATAPEDEVDPREYEVKDRTRNGAGEVLTHRDTIIWRRA